MRALWIDLFMELDKVTKKSINLDQPDEKIQFEIFKTLSWSQLLTNFDEILTLCLSFKGVVKLLTADSITKWMPPNTFFSSKLKVSSFKWRTIYL